MSPLGKRLRELRENRGWTVHEFAARIEKSPGYVSRIEVRLEVPSPNLLCSIAEVYEVPPEELLDLAKQSQLQNTQRQIEAKHESALALFRKEPT